jgi:hypothetical protein
MKTLLVITGPQGSGNHLFSKIFAANPNVFGWKELNDTYWVPHDQEPFAEAWNNPELLKHVEFNKFAFTSISCPYVYKGKRIIPRYEEFFSAAKQLGYRIKVGIIGRDKNVLEHQQSRLRGQVTLAFFEERLHLFNEYNPVYLSTELLYLYKGNYIKSIAKQLEFPVHVSASKLDEILAEDPNQKYIIAAEPTPLDNIVRSINGLNNTSAEQNNG